MTTELTKAAQQEHTPEHIAGVDHAHELLRRMGYHRDGDWFIHVNRRGAEAIHISTISTIVNAGQMALTQRPAAQTEREAFEAWYVDHCPDLTCEPIGSRLFTLQLEAWQARASLPAQPAAQDTPEPEWETSPKDGEQWETTPKQATQQAAGEPVAWESTTAFYTKYITDSRYQKLKPEFQRWYKPYHCSSCANHPEPGVPEVAREALERIASWNEHPAMLGVDYGSNGVRDYYRKIARDALAGA